MKPWIMVLSIFILAIGYASLTFRMSYHDHEHTHDSINPGDKVCIDGGGYFPYGMPEPSPFLVCGVIDDFNPDEPETVEPPPYYPEGSHRLEGVDSQT